MKRPIILFALFLAVVVLLTGFWPAVSTSVFPTSSWGLYSRPFFANLLSSAHGSILDFFVISIVLYGFDLRAKRREELARAASDRAISITRHREALADLRFYKGDDVSYRTLSALKHLMALSAHDIFCPDINLIGQTIEHLKLKGSKLAGAQLTGADVKHIEASRTTFEGADFSNARLRRAEFQEVNFSRTNFTNASLAGVDFSACKLERANFRNANLRSANFSNTDCKGVIFKGADLRSANFIGAKNITPEMLAEAKDASYIQTRKKT